MGKTFLMVVFPIILGTIAIALMNVVRRYVMRSEAVSTLQFLTLYYTAATMVFGMVYIFFWGFTLPPKMLPGLWTAALGNAIVNVFIEFFEVKAASIDKGEVSLTAPLQAMTPGLITGLALLLGEYPSRIGVTGIALMVAGSYVLLWERTPEHWYQYFGPIKRLLLLSKLGRLSREERNKTIVVTLAFGSACMGTIGLLFDGLYTRRSLTMQGLILTCMGIVTFLAIVYAAWYLIRCDAKPTQRFCNCFRRATIIPILVMGILWVLHIVAIQPVFNQTFVGYVGTLKRFSILISVVLGYYSFKEGDFKKRLWAAILIVAGAMLIASDDLPSKLSVKIVGLGF